MRSALSFFGFQMITDWSDTEWITANTANETLAQSVITEKEPQSDKLDYKLN